MNMCPSASRSSRRLCSAGTARAQTPPAHAQSRPQPALLTLAQVRVDAHVARCARQALVLAVWDVLLGFRVDVLLGQPEVDDVDRVLPLAARPPDQEVLGLHIAVDEALGMHVLHARDLRVTRVRPECVCVGGGLGAQAQTQTRSAHPAYRTPPHQLDSDHQHRLQCEGAVAQVEKVLQAGPQQLQHHGVVLPTRAEVVDLRDSLCEGNIHAGCLEPLPACECWPRTRVRVRLTCRAELLVEAVLQVQLWGPGLDGLLWGTGLLPRAPSHARAQGRARAGHTHQFNSHVLICIQVLSWRGIERLSGLRPS